MAELRSRLDAATDTVLDTDAWPGEVLSAVQSMAGLFAELSEIDLGGDDDPETVLAQGTALSPRDAARCLLDMARTSRFLRGVVGGVEAVRQRFPGRAIEIVYAGCGPFATLAVPVCTRYSPDEVRFTLIDVHERSLVAARTIVEALGLADHFRTYVLCDAAQYRHDTPAHVVITEAMQRALAKEPQLSITDNLAPQLADGGVHIPERITVDVALADLAREFCLTDPASPDATTLERDRVPITRLIEVSANSIGAIMRSADDEGALPPVIVRMPTVDEDSNYSVILRTRIEVFSDIVLDDYDSGLTCPLALHEVGRVRGGETLELRYHLGHKPGFRVVRFVAAS